MNRRPRLSGPIIGATLLFLVPATLSRARVDPEVVAKSAARSTTTTVPDDYLNLFPTGVPDDWSGEIPGTGSHGAVLPFAVLVSAAGAVFLGTSRSFRRSSARRR